MYITYAAHTGVNRHVALLSESEGRVLQLSVHVYLQAG